MKEFIIQNKNLMSEWDWEENNKIGLNPNTLTCGSGKKAWWLCGKGHKWLAAINSRIKGASCPFCAGQRVITGKNDLSTINPSLANEWNYNKNLDLTPQTVMPNSGKKVWWVCEVCKFEWKASISSRNRGSGCPKCSERRQTSFPEQVIYFYLKRVYPDAINRFRSQNLKNKELDIFIPSLNLGIEYDGALWHRSEDDFTKELFKYKLCKENDITLIRVKEKLYDSDMQTCDFLIVTDTEYDCASFQKIFNRLNDILNIKIVVDLEKDELEIKSSFFRDLKENSVGEKFPILINEWNFDKNKSLTPFAFRPNSHDKVWWKCTNGHEWQASISNRVKGNNCPYCSGKSILIGLNDLQTTDPILAGEWDYDKNIDILPSMFSNGSHKKVWWKCANGHEWQAYIYHRSHNNSGCPYCKKHIKSNQ